MKKSAALLVVILIAFTVFAQEDVAKKAEVEKALKSKTITLAMADCSIANVMSFLQDISGLNIVIDSKVDSELTVDIKLTSVTLESALNNILLQRELDYIVKKDGVVFISTKKRIAELKGEGGKKEAGDLKEGELFLFLKDGSKIKGKVAVDKWKLKTAYGELTIPSGEIRKIILRQEEEKKEDKEEKEEEKKEDEKDSEAQEEAPGEDTVETIRFTVTGELEIDKLVIDKDENRLTIPRSDIKQILFPKTAVKKIKKDVLGRIKADFKAVEDAIAFFKLDTGRYPDKLQDLLVNSDIKGWKGPYLKKQPLDPWKVPYIYELAEEEPFAFELKTLGADKVEGGDGENKDLSNLDFHKER